MKNSNINVVTVSGKTLPRIKCRYISNQYYEIGEDCFLMEDGKWHRKGNGKIEYDFELNKYVLLDISSMLRGIVDIDAKGSFVLGYFSPNPAKNAQLTNREYGNIRCLNEDIPKKAGYKEHIASGVFYNDLDAKTLNKKGIEGRYSFQLEYSSAPKIQIFNGAYLENYQKKNDKDCSFAKELGDSSYGFEFETENGFIPERFLFRNGLIPVKDGSLRHDHLEPYEYTTIPLSGEKGVSTLVDIAELLNKYTTTGHRCSLHLHIGGFKRTESLIVGMHKLMIRIQDELFDMFPPNYKFTSKNGFKQKDYCAPVKGIRFSKEDSIRDKFMKIVAHFAGGNTNFRGFGVDNHPRDRANSRKWDIVERYFICNFVPVLWGPTGTFEFRVHPPTQNISKIINWLFICNAIVKFADKYQKELADDSMNMRPVNLEYILRDVYSKKICDVLCAYIEKRKLICAELAESKNDLIGDYELKHDTDAVKDSLL